MEATQGEHYSGDLPLTFIVWYRPAFENELENYINDLKAKADKPTHPAVDKPTD